MVREDQGPVYPIGMSAAITSRPTSSSRRNMEELFEVRVQTVAIRAAAGRQLSCTQEGIGVSHHHGQAGSEATSSRRSKSPRIRRQSFTRPPGKKDPAQSTQPPRFAGHCFTSSHAIPTSHLPSDGPGFSQSPNHAIEPNQQDSSQKTKNSG